jgi:hypothetical protein
LDISNDKGVKTMLEEVEKLYAARFGKASNLKVFLQILTQTQPMGI